MMQRISARSALATRSRRRVFPLCFSVLCVLASGCSDVDRSILKAPESVEEQEESPDATETNFFRLPCDQDSDCFPDEVCVIPERAAGDAGVPLGRCEDSP